MKTWNLVKSKHSVISFLYSLSRGAPFFCGNPLPRPWVIYANVNFTDIPQAKKKKKSHFLNKVVFAQKQHFTPFRGCKSPRHPEKGKSRSPTVCTKSYFGRSKDNECLEAIISLRNYKVVAVSNQQVHFIWSMVLQYFLVNCQYQESQIPCKILSSG